MPGLGRIVLARIVRFVVFFGVMIGLVVVVQLLGIALPYWGYGGICVISFIIAFAVSYLIRSGGSEPQAPRPSPYRPPDRYREPRYDRRREPPRRDHYRERDHDRRPPPRRDEYRDRGRDRRPPPRRDDYRDREYDDHYDGHYDDHNDDHYAEDYCRYCDEPLDYDSDICPRCRRRN